MMNIIDIKIAMATGYVDFARMSGFTMEVVLDTINDCLKIADKHKGTVLGGFVRDVVIPRKVYPKCQVRFKDVDIWFTSQANANAFLTEMGDKLKSTPISKGLKSIPGPMYNFSRQQYHLYLYDACVAWIDVIISDKIPVNDFNINKLGYHYTTYGPVLESFGDETVEALVTAIQNKTIVMLPEYMKLIADGKAGVADIHIERVRTRYLARGWKIRLYDGNEEVHMETIDSPWMHKVLSARKSNEYSQYKVLTQEEHMKAFPDLYVTKVDPVNTNEQCVNKVLDAVRSLRTNNKNVFDITMNLLSSLANINDEEFNIRLNIYRAGLIAATKL